MTFPIGILFTSAKAYRAVMTSSDDVTIESARNHERAAALELVLSDLPPQDRSIQARQLLETLPIEQWAGLMVARVNNTLCGALWAQDVGGGGVMLWPPRLAANASSATAGRLIMAAMDALRHRATQLAQALLPFDAEEDTQLLQSAGFQRLADLVYLACLTDKIPNEKPASGLKFLPWQPELEQRMASLVERTYHGTLDLPELNGLRTAAEVLAEYRAASQYDPRLWFLVQQGSTDVGCLILNDHADIDQFELVYVGLIPEARGNGWGRKIIEFAQWQARQRGRARLLLAVSADNHPALQMYAATGFFQWQRRRTLVWFGSDQGGHTIIKS